MRLTVQSTWLADQEAARVAAELALERAAMTPFAAAFWFALKERPSAGYASLLERVRLTVEAAKAIDPDSAIVIWFQKVQQIVRTHPDMTAFRGLFDLEEEDLDDLCRRALQLEAGE